MLDSIASSLQSTKFLLLLWSLVFALKHGWLQRIRNLSRLAVRFCGQRVKAPSLSEHLAFNWFLIGRSHTCMCAHTNRQRIRNSLLINITCFLQVFLNRYFHNSHFNRNTELTCNKCKQGYFCIVHLYRYLKNVIESSFDWFHQTKIDNLIIIWALTLACVFCSGGSVLERCWTVKWTMEGSKRPVTSRASSTSSRTSSSPGRPCSMQLRPH